MHALNKQGKETQYSVAYKPILLPLTVNEVPVYTTDSRTRERSSRGEC